MGRKVQSPGWKPNVIFHFFHFVPSRLGKYVTLCSFFRFLEADGDGFKLQVHCNLVYPSPMSKGTLCIWMRPQELQQNIDFWWAKNRLIYFGNKKPPLGSLLSLLQSKKPCQQLLTIKSNNINGKVTREQWLNWLKVIQGNCFQTNIIEVFLKKWMNIQYILPWSGHESLH